MIDPLSFSNSKSRFAYNSSRKYNRETPINLRHVFETACLSDSGQLGLFECYCCLNQLGLMVTKADLEAKFNEEIKRKIKTIFFKEFEEIYLYFVNKREVGGNNDIITRRSFRINSDLESPRISSAVKIPREYPSFAFEVNNCLAVLKEKKKYLVLKSLDKIEGSDILDLIQSRVSKYKLSAAQNLKWLLGQKKQRRQAFLPSNYTNNLSALCDLWHWVSNCEQYRKETDKSKINFVEDPANGINGLVDFGIELSKRSPMKVFDYSVYDSEGRCKALSVCGWCELFSFAPSYAHSPNFSSNPTTFSVAASENFSWRNPKLSSIIAELKNTDQHYRAIAVAVFHFDFQKALDILNTLPNLTESIYSDDFEIKNEVEFLRGILTGLRNIQYLVDNDHQLREKFIYRADDHKKNYSGNKDEGEEPDNLKDFDLYRIDIDEKYLKDFLAIKNLGSRYSIINQSWIFLRIVCGQAEFRQPYLKIVCKFIYNNDGESGYILNNKDISIFDKIAFALRFLSFEKLREYFNDIKSMPRTTPDLIIFSGRDEHTIKVLQNYLDNENDIQTVGLVSVFLYVFKFPCEEKLLFWYNSYRDLLNRLQLWDIRALLDRDYQELERIHMDKKNLPNVQGRNASVSLDPPNSNPQKMFWCICNFNATKLGETSAGALPYNQKKVETSLKMTNFARIEKEKLFNCLNCNRPLPNCAICLLPTTISNNLLENNRAIQPNFLVTPKRSEFSMFDSLQVEDGLIWCLSCKHGGHYKHIIDWFSSFKMCHVNDCPCECSSI